VIDPSVPAGTVVVSGVTTTGAPVVGVHIYPVGHAAGVTATDPVPLSFADALQEERAGIST
jgi:hypothetical protein